ncbi:MAG: hypothetical protein LBJ90_04695, partial [Treponema sp.]|nr:hypothetical protein [Treponema sp.]
DRPCYWKNGTRQTLSSFALAPGQTVTYFTGGIAVSGSGDVYIPGYYYEDDAEINVPRPCYWRNSSVFELSTGTESIAVAVALLGSDVYILGFDDTYTAFFWKNGQRNTFPFSTAGIDAMGFALIDGSGGEEGNPPETNKSIFSLRRSLYWQR